MDHRFIPLRFFEAMLGRDMTADLLITAGVDPSCEAVDHLTFWRILRDNIVRTGDERHSLGPTAVPDGSFALLLAAMRLGDTLGDGLGRLADAARIVRPDLLIASRKGRSLVISFSPGSSVPTQLYVELFVVVLHVASCWMTGAIFRPRAVVVPRCDEPVSGSFYTMLGCPVTRRGRRVELRYAADDADRALSAEHFDLWPTLVFEAYRQFISSIDAKPTSVADLVRVRLFQALGSQSTVASDLSLSVASLRRRLADEATSFRLIENEVRSTLAAEAMRSGRPLDDVAEELGYSDSRSLRRAVNRWFGAPPSLARKRRKLVSEIVR